VVWGVAHASFDALAALLGPSERRAVASHRPVVDRGRLVGMISARDLLIFAATPHLRG
jgi:CBS domain-containing protein